MDDVTPVKFTKQYHVHILWGIYIYIYRTGNGDAIKGNIFRVTGTLSVESISPGGFPLKKPVMQSFDVFFDLRLNKRVSKITRR